MHKNKLHKFIYISFNFIFPLILWPFLPSMGISIIGPAFVLAYIVSFLINIILVSRLHSFHWEKLSIFLLLIHTSLSLVLLVIALNYPYHAAIISIVMAITTGLLGGRIIISKIGNINKVTEKIFSFFQFIGWPAK